MVRCGSASDEEGSVWTDIPMIMVLSLRAWPDVSMEGMVPERARGLAMAGGLLGVELEKEMRAGERRRV